MDVTPRTAAWSAAWGVVAAILGGGAVASWMATVAPESKFPAWPAATLTALTAVALYVAFAHLAGKWPTDGDGRNDEPANVDLIPEQVGNQLRLMLVNHGLAAEFLVQIIGMLDPLRQRKAPKHWTIPWLEDNSVEPKRVLAGGTQMLDFVRYDADAVNTELTTGHDGADHWLFSAVPTSVGVRYYNLLSQNDLDVQQFTLTARIMNASSGEYLDRQLTVRSQGCNLICELT
jgi:hypothetical protein